MGFDGKMKWQESLGLLSLAGFPEGNQIFLVNESEVEVAIDSASAGSIPFEKSEPQVCYKVRMSSPPEGFKDQRIAFFY